MSARTTAFAGGSCLSIAAARFTAPWARSDRCCVAASQSASGKSTRASCRAALPISISESTNWPIAVSAALGSVIVLVLLRRLLWEVDFLAGFGKLHALGFHAGDSLGFDPQILGNFHRTEFRPAHGTEMRHLMRLFWQRLVMEGSSRIRIEGQVELVLPSKFEPRAADCVISQLRRRMPLRQIGRMCGDP